MSSLLIDISALSPADIAVYLADETKVITLMDAALQLPNYDDAIGFILNNGPRIPGEKVRDIGYLYLLRKLLTTPALLKNKRTPGVISSLLSLSWPISVLVRAFDADMDKIAAAHARWQNGELVESPYVYAVSFLLDSNMAFQFDPNSTFEKDSSLLKEFLAAQLTFAETDAAIALNFLPLLEDEENSVYLPYIGNVTNHAEVFAWIARLLIRKNADYGPELALLEFEGAVSILNAANPKNRNTVVAQLRQLVDGKYDKEHIDKSSEAVSADYERVMAFRNFALPIYNRYKQLGFVSEAAGKQMTQEISAFPGQDRDFTYKDVLKAFRGMYGIPEPVRDWEPREDLLPPPAFSAQRTQDLLPPPAFSTQNFQSRPEDFVPPPAFLAQSTQDF